MSNLLLAGFHRLIKSKLYICLLIFSALFGLYVGNYTNTHFYFEGNYLYVFSAMFIVHISLNMGIEFSQGSIRNKIVMGYKRSTVFFSELIILLLSSMLLVIISLAMFLVFNAHWFSVLTTSEIIIIFIVFILYNTALSVICTAVCFFFAARPASMTAVNLILIIAAVFISFLIDNKLRIPEYSYSAMIDENNNVIQEEMTLNQDYIPRNSAVYMVLNTVYNMTPSAQAYDFGNDISVVWSPMMLNYTENNLSELDEFPVYSLATITLFSAASWLSFRKRNLR